MICSPRLLNITGLSLLALIFLCACAFAGGLRVVWTDSLPRGLYWVHPGATRRGSIVSACLPPIIARFGMERGYISSGQCPGGSGGVAKMVAAVAGDTVRINTHGVFINKYLWPWSTSTATDWSGRPLGARSGVFRIRSGEVLLMGLNPHSWDARYFGPVPQRFITGLATPLLIENGAATAIIRNNTIPRS